VGRDVRRSADLSICIGDQREPHGDIRIEAGRVYVTILSDCSENPGRSSEKHPTIFNKITEPKATLSKDGDLRISGGFAAAPMLRLAPNSPRGRHSRSQADRRPRETGRPKSI
jgi:hypothetical protein